MPTLTLPDRHHGQRSMYVAGCRCHDCRAANTSYARDRRVRREQEAAARILAGLLDQLRPPALPASGTDIPV